MSDNDRGNAPSDESIDSAPRLGGAELKAILEALIFASPEPLTPKQIAAPKQLPSQRQGAPRLAPASAQ